MKERPILFSAPMVQSLLAGRKTQTRRVVNRLQKFGKITEFQKSDTSGYDWIFRNLRMLWNDLRHPRLMEVCPYGKPGDRLWVRENFQPLFNDEACPHGDDPDWEKLDWKTGKGYRIHYPATDGIAEYYDVNEEEFCQHVKPSIHMPRWASRITLEITDVRVQRVQEISEEDATAEGTPEAVGLTPGGLLGRASARHCFKKLWDSINAARGYGWEANPWVWVVSFKLLPRGAC